MRNLSGSTGRMRHFEGTGSRSWARRGQGALPAVLEEDDDLSKANPVMFDHWRRLTERYNRVQLSDTDVLNISSGSLRPRSGRSTPGLRSASLNRSGPLRPRSQASHRVEPKEWNTRRESRQSSRESYPKGLRGDRDPEEEEEESSEERESGEEDEASMDETLPEKPSKGQKSRREHHRTDTTPPQFYMPPPIVYQLPSPYSMYPAAMPYYYPPQPYSYPPYSQPQSPAPPAFKPHPNPFSAEKRDSSTQVRATSPPTPKARPNAPSLPRPVYALKVPASKPDSPGTELAQDDTGPTIPSPIALEIGLSESKSLADIFRERRKDFDQRSAQRKAAKATHSEKTASELLALRKEMLKPPSLASKPSPSPKASDLLLDFETDRKKSEPPPDLLDRLAAGSKAKVSRKEMLELTSKNYQSLPEVVRKREEEAKRSDAQQRLAQRKEYEKVRTKQKLQERTRKGRLE